MVLYYKFVCNVIALFKIILGPYTVWIIGSSIIRDAQDRAKQRTEGEHLGLRRLNGSVFWLAKPGMRLHDINSAVSQMLDIHKSPPAIIVIHCGGNDIGQMPIHLINVNLKAIMSTLLIRLPKTLLVWSDILPRKLWRNEITHKKLEKCRQRTNSYIGNFMVDNSCATIHYPEIHESIEGLYRDGVHLSTLGYDIMLNTLQGALYKFSTSTSQVFPRSHEIGPWLDISSNTWNCM